MRRFSIVGATVLACVGAFAAPAAAVDKVTICHRTGNGSFVTITVAAHATLSGHIAHPGDIIPAPAGGCLAAATTGGTTGTTGGATATTGTTGGTTGTTGGTTGTTGGTTAGTTGGTAGTTTGGVGTTGGTVPTTGELPFTGLPVWIPLLAAGGLLGSGIVLLRRRQKQEI